MSYRLVKRLGLRSNLFFTLIFAARNIFGEGRLGNYLGHFVLNLEVGVVAPRPELEASHQKETQSGDFVAEVRHPRQMRRQRDVHDIHHDSREVNVKHS